MSSLARPIMGTIFLVIYIYIYDSQLNRPESVSLASLARQLYPLFSIEQTWECLARFARSPIIIIHFFRRVFSECTEAITTSLTH